MHDVWSAYMSESTTLIHCGYKALCVNVDMTDRINIDSTILCTQFSLNHIDKHNSFSHTECTIDTWQRWCNLKHSRRTRVRAQNHPAQLEWKMVFILPPASRMKSPKYLKSVHLSKCHSLWIISCLQCRAVRQSKLLRKQRQLCLTVCNRR